MSGMERSPALAGSIRSRKTPSPNRPDKKFFFTFCVLKLSLKQTWNKKILFQVCFRFQIHDKVLTNKNKNKKTFSYCTFADPNAMGFFLLLWPEELLAG